MRAQVVLLRGDEILLARHVAADREYWVLPGGAVEDDETPEEAAVREVREESGLEIEIDRHLFVDGPKRAPRFEVKHPRHTFLGRIVGGELRAVVESESADGHCETPNGYLAGAAWMPVRSDEFDDATRDTLALVCSALENVNGQIASTGLEDNDASTIERSGAGNV